MKRFSILAISLACSAAFAVQPATQSDISITAGAAFTNLNTARAFAMVDKLKNQFLSWFSHGSGDAANPLTFKFDIATEGAGKLTTNGVTIRYHMLCETLDTIADKKVIDGVGDCHLTATDGGEIDGHFQTIPGRGDRGHFTFKPGTKSFANVQGSVPVDITVNPYKVAGKFVYFVESSDESTWTK